MRTKISLEGALLSTSNLAATHAAAVASGIDWGGIAKTIAEWTGPPALLLAAFNTWTKRSENRQLHRQNGEIENLRSDLRQFENRSKTEYDWLHQRRAEAAVELYGLVVDIDMATEFLAGQLHHSETAQEKAALLKGVTDSLAAYRERYSKLALLLPENIVNQLGELNVAITLRFINARAYGLHQDAWPISKMEKNWSEVNRRVKELRASLRTALGDVERDAQGASENR